MRSPWIIFVAAGVVIAGGSAWVWHRYGPSTEEVLWSILGPSLAIMGALAKWARKSRRNTGEGTDGTALLADALAESVMVEWESETQIRNLENPQTIPLEWENADGRASARWETIRRAPGVNARIDLSGRLSEREPFRGDDITQLFERLPSGRLVVLGAPGSGKTAIAMRLVTFITAARRDGSLAVLLPLASWNCKQLTFLDWVTSRLAQHYPEPMADMGPESATARKLLRSGRIVFILDGLDELPASLRSETIRRLNQQLSNRIRIVLTCRSAEYEEAGYALNDAAVVEIQPLDQPTICGYLEALTQPSPHDSLRWKPVLAELEGDPAGPLAQALDTPLMIWLARTVYTSSDTHPEILVSRRPDGSRVFPTPSSIKNHLLERVISAAYADAMVDGARRLRYSGRNAERWLKFMAVQLDDYHEYDLAVWRLHRSMGRVTKCLVYGCAFGAAVGLWGALLYNMSFGLSFGVITGMSAGVAAAYAGPAEPPYGTASGESFFHKYKSGLAFTISLWFASGLATVIALGLWPGISVWCWEALAAALAGGLAIPLSKRFDAKNEQVSTPLTILKLSRKVTLAWAALFGSLLLLGMALSKGAGAALVAGLIGALGATFANAWGGLVVTRGYFALTRRLPWRLMSFLADAHQRGILRQVGAVYQFRHATIQDRLAHVMHAKMNKRPPGRSLWKFTWLRDHLPFWYTFSSRR